MIELFLCLWLIFCIILSESFKIKVSLFLRCMAVWRLSTPSFVCGKTKTA